MFTLKVIHDEKARILRADTRHECGGIDATQIAAFNHLFPCGECDEFESDELQNLAELHGWRVETEHVFPMGDDNDRH